MLASLSIRNFVIVDALDLEFTGGFSVLTGETGAGKSILIDALQLALGERADADVVREGAARADVTAEFRVHAAARTWLADAALDADGDTLLLRRTVDAGGRSKAFINGIAATLAQVRELGELLLDVHGQHAHQSLLRPAAQQRVLDEHGGLTVVARDVASAFAAWRRAAQATAAAAAMASSAAAERDRLRWIADDLTELAPQVGEWNAVQTEHKRLAHAAGLIEAAHGAIDALSQADGSALATIDANLAKLTPLVAVDDRLQPIVDALAAARAQADDAVRELGHYVDKTALDDARLAELDDRMGRLHAAARKFKTNPDELPALLADAQAKIAALAASSDLEALQRAEARALAAFTAAAAALSAQRRVAAQQMAREVTRAMQDLSMAGGSFEVSLTPDEPSSAGLERVEFRVAGHAGVAPKPLAKVASGGELARISLAIAVIAAAATPVATLIFDEVDAGVGGAVAETVGRLLKALGQMRQVLCVTHLPQVAARADQHLRVSKEQSADGRPVSRIAALERSARVEELARMLGGLEITDTTRKHAREMLAA